MNKPVERILLINAYSAQNRGDAGIVIAMINLLKTHYNDPEINVMSSYHQENKKTYEQFGAQSVPAIWNISNHQSLLVKYIQGLLIFISALLNPNNGKFIQYTRADMIISVGGGYLYSSKKGPLGLGLLNVLFHYWLGTHKNKCVIGFPQSVGPFNHKIDKKIVSKVLKKIPLVFSREHHTTTTLKQLGINNWHETLDIAFHLNITPSKNTPSKKHLEIGLTVLDWKFAKSTATENAMQNYLDKLTSVIQQFLEKHPNSRFTIFPQVTVEGQDNDIHISEKLCSKINSNRVTIEYPGDNMSVIELANRYSEMDAFIASRMHSAIFALAGKTPTVALSYQPKTDGVFKMLGLSNQVFDIELFKPCELFSCLESLVQQSKNDLQVDLASHKSELLNLIDSKLSEAY